MSRRIGLAQLKFFGIYAPMTTDEELFMSTVTERRQVGYGRMMQMISGLWRAEVGDAALLANDTYHGYAAKLARCKREGHDWNDNAGGSYDWCDRCGTSTPRPRRKARKVTK